MKKLSKVIGRFFRRIGLFFDKVLITPITRIILKLMNFFKNKVALLILITTFTIQILVTQFAGGFFHTVPLSAMMWVKIIVVGSTVVLFNELVKWMVRLFNQSRKRSKRVKKAVHVSNVN